MLKRVASLALAVALLALMMLGGTALAASKKPTKVTLDRTGTVTLKIDETLALNAALHPETATSKLTWSTSSKKIATVKGGVVTPVKEGTVTITVRTENGKKAKVKVKVVDPYKPTGVKLDKSGTVSVNLGETLTLNATLKPDIARSKLTWSTSSKKIATVKGGVVTPVKEGTATITVKTANGKKATVKVKVVDPTKPTGIKFDPAGEVKVNLGEPTTLNAVMTPATAKSKLTWSTSSKKIATVKGGVVTPVKEGTATITVKTANGKKATVKVKVVDPTKPTGIKLDKSGTVVVRLGETLALNATMTPATAKSKLTWSTSDKKIATVDANGVVTPVKEGTATITVTTGNKKAATVQVKVEPTVVVLPERVIEEAIFRQLNEHRRKNGLKELRLDEELCAVARLRAEETTRLFSHTRPDGSICFTAFPDKCKSAGENIAYCSHKANQATILMELWKNSPGHNANMLDAGFEYVGIGVVTHAGRTYGVQVFASYFGR